MDRSVIQVRIDDPPGFTRQPRFARGRRRYQFVKQLPENRGVMGQLIGDKQRLVRASVSHIAQYPPGVIKFASVDPECDQQARGGVDTRPDPRLSVLVFKVFGVVRTFLFFTKVHSSSSCVSVNSRDFSRFESARAQCSPARRITRLTVSLSSPNNRAVARTPTPSAAW